MPAFKDISGQRFNRLVAVEYKGKRKWKFNCDCGKQTVTRIGDVKLGRTQSCGCLREEGFLKQTIHGHGSTGNGGKGTPAWNTWKDMRQRCNNANNEAFKWYGARGISVCDKWSDFRNFLSDMGEKPHGLSIGRIDNDGNYCKENCRWETPIQQSNNQRNNR